MVYEGLKFVLTIICSVCAICVYYSIPEASIPELPNTWWGPGEETSDIDKSIRPFKIEFSDTDIRDLKARLNNTRSLTPALNGTGWQYGTAGEFITNTIIDYWMNKYQFQKRVEYLNKFDHYLTNIQGLDIHFIHVKPKNTEGKVILPIMILHGWPGSFAEFYYLIPILTTPRKEHDFVFEVIVPSLPGFAFSQATNKPGLGSPQIAVILKNFMLRLGFQKFYAHGGDFGSVIISQMAALFPKHVAGMHSNMCTSKLFESRVKTILYSLFPFLLPEDDRRAMYPIKDYLFDKLLETGYLHLQASKPDTVAVGLTDSPAGLAAYILEKFSVGTNRSYKMRNDGGLFQKLSPDFLIDNLMIYWIPNAITTSMRIYAESFSSTNFPALLWTIKIPAGCCQFPNEFTWLRTPFLSDRFNLLLQFTKMPKGGHWAALEEPKLLADDIWSFVAIVENIALINQSKDEI